MKISKWLQIGLVNLILASVLLAGCGSDSDYEALQAEHATVVEENARLKEDLQSVQSDLARLQADYDKLRGESEVEYQSVFKSPQGEAAYMAAYDRALEKWPVPYETRYVPTSYGDIHMIVSGPEDAEPLVLLHGKSISATVWYPNVAALASTYRVYALDWIPDLGKSRVKRVYSDRAEFAEWLTEVLDELEIEKAYMMGHSMGGFLTTCYALEEPERLKKIVLLAPAATFAPFGKGFTLDMALPGMVGGLLNDIYELKRAGSYAIEGFSQAFNISEEERAEAIKDEDLAKSMLEFSEESLEELEGRIDSVLRIFAKNVFAPGNFVQDEVIDQMLVGTKYEKAIMQFGPYPLPDEELKELEVPTLLLVGDHEILYAADPDQVLKRAEELVENIQTVLIPNAGHSLTIEEPELCNSRILQFLSGDD